MIRSIQYMRAIAALLVVFHHAAWKAHQHTSDPWAGFRVGEAGVDLFFIISGFIMCEATRRRPVSFGAFMKARAVRILPRCSWVWEPSVSSGRRCRSSRAS